MTIKIGQSVKVRGMNATVKYAEDNRIFMVEAWQERRPHGRFINVWVLLCEIEI